MFVIKHKKIFLAFSATLVLASVIIVSVWGLNLGVDFTGGTIVEVRYSDGRPSLPDLDEQLLGLGIEGASIRPTNDDGYIIRSKELQDEQRQSLNSLFSSGEISIERFNTVGPVIGKELRNKSYYAIASVMIAIIIFIAIAFRKVSRPVSSWKYGITAIVALIHDVAIPVGVLSVLGHFSGSEVDVLFVMALLAILGYSVNDTIVVFDRVRENLQINAEDHRKESLSDVVGKSLKQTYTRSINTSVTTLIVLLTLLFIGGPTIHTFILTLIIGVLAGTYSSIFLASPLLTLFTKE